MDKAWRVFSLFMAFLSILCLAAYIVVEIKGIHLGIGNWIMILLSVIVWVWLAYGACKKGE